MSTYRVAQVAGAGETFHITEREVPRPGPRHVRIAVEACGICHSDALFVNALVPGVRFPLVPGHENAGRIAELGEGAVDMGWQVGDRVAVGWFGGSCGHCTQRRQGDFIVCAGLKVPGWAYDIGADTQPLGINPDQLLMSGRVLRGQPFGTAQDVQDVQYTMAFSALHGIRPMAETVPLDQADAADRKMLSGAARFRMVLTSR
ncbi:alcohol dehydrogenase catalytic domain-containing protein [Streptomyces sediminimaris]|uniref:alcohol dehydrogenase catalytic domain-containing protein n=1 Tax=Streptomyces sediminimaris TaxID=3383721 RepID=UPI00399AE089